MKKTILALSTLLAGTAHAHPQDHAHLAEMKKQHPEITDAWGTCYLGHWHMRHICTEAKVIELRDTYGAALMLYALTGKKYQLPAVHKPIFDYFHDIPIDPVSERINDVYFCEQHNLAEKATCEWATIAIADVKKDIAKVLKNRKFTIETKSKPTIVWTKPPKL